MKLLVDMNLSPRWVDVLPRRHTRGSLEHRRREGCERCRDMAHALATTTCTHADLDLSAILAATHGEKPSVVQVRAHDISPDVIGRRVVAALRQAEAELLAGAVLTIDTTRERLRLLPLPAAVDIAPREKGPLTLPPLPLAGEGPGVRAARCSSVFATA